jgi:SAM-dependent methyltransferase
MSKIIPANSRGFGKPWDDYARGDWKRYIWAEASDSEESFRASGERNHRKYVGGFLSALGIDPKGLIALDLGAGVGRVSEFLARDFRGLVAVDSSPGMLRIGRKRVGADNVLWLCNDGGSLKAMADASVDFTFSHSVFQHIPDAEGVAACVREAGLSFK